MKCVRITELPGSEIYCIVFEFDYETREASEPKVAVSRDAFQKTEAKRKELRNVVYPGVLR